MSGEKSQRPCHHQDLEATYVRIAINYPQTLTVVPQTDAAHAGCSQTRVR